MIGQALVTYDKADGDFTLTAQTVAMENYPCLLYTSRCV